MKQRGGSVHGANNAGSEWRGDRVMGSLLEAKGCRSMHDFEAILMSNAHMIREHDISEQIYWRLFGCDRAMAAGSQPHVSRLPNHHCETSDSARHHNISTFPLRACPASAASEAISSGRRSHEEPLGLRRHPSPASTTTSACRLDSAPQLPCASLEA